MDDLSTEELELVTGGEFNNTLRAVGLASTLLVNETLPELPQPKRIDPTPIVRTMEPITPPALPGGATIKTTRNS